MVHRLFHFDIKTLANYGDTILFEMVRETFNTFQGRKTFYVAGSSNLRETVGRRLVDKINESYDAVVIGGGGLFLADTNPNDRSGWQWDCSMELLERIEKPLIVFAVGNNRFPGQPEFGDRFREHVNKVVEKSVFFGLRNTGSVRTIRDHLKPELREKVVWQPCPTTLIAKLCPDLYDEKLEPAKRLSIQTYLSKRHTDAGFDRDGIYDGLVRALSTLQGRGWRVESFANARGDRAFSAHARANGLELPVTAHFDKRHIFNPLRAFAKLPLAVGMRGHAQMIPFGLGVPIVSLFNHDKLRYFLDDISAPELLVDVREPGFEDALVDRAEHVLDNFASIRAHFAAKQEEMFALTMRNLASISKALGGDGSGAGVKPYSAFERKLAQSLWLATYDKEQQAAGLPGASPRADVNGRDVADVDAQAVEE